MAKSGSVVDKPSVPRGSVLHLFYFINRILRTDFEDAEQIEAYLKPLNLSGCLCVTPLKFEDACPIPITLEVQPRKRVRVVNIETR